MSGEEKRGSTEARVELYQVLKAHKLELEDRRGVSARDEEILDRRIEAVQLLIEWLEQELEIEPTGPTRR
jgi:hypothetical protein